MDVILYEVDKIDGDYAYLKRIEEAGTFVDEESKLVARALLPENIQEGSKLIYEWLQYRIAE